MEASEKPQLAIDVPSEKGDGIVRALDDRLVIERLTVSDKRAARVVRERAEGGQEAARTVADAIEIGARVLDREDVAAEVDYVRAEFERHAGELRERLTSSLETGDERLAERISHNFDGSRDSSVQKEIAELVRRALEEQRVALLKQFSAEDGANPLTDFKGAIVRAFRDLGTRQQAGEEALRKRLEALTREVVELRKDEEADQLVAEAEAAGTRKGLSFEDRVHEALDRIARSRGDCATHTGGEQAEGGGRKGDTLVELEAADPPPHAGERRARRALERGARGPGPPRSGGPPCRRPQAPAPRAGRALGRRSGRPRWGRPRHSDSRSRRLAPVFGIQAHNPENGRWVGGLLMAASRQFPTLTRVRWRGAARAIGRAPRAPARRARRLPFVWHGANGESSERGPTGPS
jgi:hypothetical protein